MEVCPTSDEVGIPIEPFSYRAIFFTQGPPSADTGVLAGFSASTWRLTGCRDVTEAISWFLEQSKGYVESVLYLEQTDASSNTILTRLYGRNVLMGEPVVIRSQRPTAINEEEK